TGALIGQQEVARDTVFDLVALPDGGVAWASHDGTWGVSSVRATALAVESRIADLKGPETLRVSQDGRRVGWTFTWGSDPATFDFERRLVVAAPAGARDLEPPDPGAGSGRAVWQNTLQARVNG